jgi:hypothetical protein
LSLEEQVEVFGQYEKYLAAKAIRATSTTYQGLAEFQVTEEKPPVEEAKDWTNDIAWQIRLFRSRISPEGSLDSHLTLEYHLADPSFYASESPFDVLDEKLADEAKIRKLINYIRDKSNIQFAQKLAARLNFLYEAAKEDPDEVQISPESLSNFIAFLKKTPNLRYPDVVLTPSNEIRAQWRTAPNRHFAVVFLPTGETRFVIFTPNLRDPDRIDRLSGMTSVDSLMETAQPHRVLDWASR